MQVSQLEAAGQLFLKGLLSDLAAIWQGEVGLLHI